MLYETLEVSLVDGVARIELNRPEKANALSECVWWELQEACRWLDATPAARVGILAGRGRHFCAGIDLEMLQLMRAEAIDFPSGHREEHLRQRIAGLQSCITALEECRKPLLASIQGACVGGGIDLITACDMRYATVDARFSVKEIDLAIVADVGTLQRLPRIVGEGIARELVLTAREFNGQEAEALRLVNRAFPTREALEAEVGRVAAAIAAKSPLAVRGTKEVLNFSRDHTVSEGLAYVATKNASLLFSPDVTTAVKAFVERRIPVFPD